MLYIVDCYYQNIMVIGGKYKMTLPSSSRVEAFSDGVLAIIITLLILEIKVPEIHGSTFIGFLNDLKPLIPKFLSFALSFTTVATFWVNHHNFFHQIKSISWKLLWYNNLLIFWICVIPFSTAFIGDFYNIKYVVALYCVNMFFAASSFTLMWRYVFILKPELLIHQEEIVKRQVESKNRQFITRGVIGPIIYFMCSFIALISIPLAFLMLFGMQIFYIIPRKY